MKRSFSGVVCQKIMSKIFVRSKKKKKAIPMVLSLKKIIDYFEQFFYKYRLLLTILYTQFIKYYAKTIFLNDFHMMCISRNQLKTPLRALHGKNSQKKN
jgi:hypothetical protein